MLEKLAEDMETEVCIEVAKNSNTPIAVLEKLAEDRRTEVRIEVARNPNTSITILEKLADDDRVAAVCIEVAKNPNTPVSALEKLFYKGNTETLKCIAIHPNVSIAILEQFSKDRDESVRELVAARIIR